MLVNNDPFTPVVLAVENKNLLHAHFWEKILYGINWPYAIFVTMPLPIN